MSRTIRVALDSSMLCYVHGQNYKRVRKELVHERRYTLRGERALSHKTRMTYKHQKLSQFMSGFLEEIWHGLRLKGVHDINRYETTKTTDENERAQQKDKKPKHEKKKMKWNAGENNNMHIVIGDDTDFAHSDEYVNVMSIYAWSQKPSLATLMKWRHRNLFTTRQ